MKVLLALFVACALFGDDRIASVTDIEGQAFATQPGQTARALAVDAPIFVKDTIDTKESSAVELKFIDESILGLKELTTYAVKDFKYSPDTTKGENHSELVKGAFRFLSGKIVSNPTDYTIKAPTATIGLLGTLVKARMEEEALYVECTEGRVQIANASGTVVIGEGMEQYAVVTSYLRRPQVFITPPPMMIRPSVGPTVIHH